MNILAVVITAFITATISSLVSLIVTNGKRAREQTKALQEKDRKLEEGVQSLLRAEIIRQNEKRIEAGYCPIYAKEALTTEYNAYHALGGNGTMTVLYNETMRLPEHPPKTQKDTEERK